VWIKQCLTRTLRNFVQFSKYQLASSDATFYILLACLILVNKFLIFIFALLQALGSFQDK
ncbi:hypothetical protein LOB66_08805, partial [Lactobacillus delbrueckii subsp. lactis]|uniref:hypothetical protein n=1 Tax=Lactobacillus delbrueckii TaxID=1584 RepID=UPI001E3E3EBB